MTVRDTLTRQQRRAHERTARKAERRSAKLATGALAVGSLLAAASATAATFTVTNLNDSGAGSLRQAVLDANATAGPDTITFQSGLTGTIGLTSGEIGITESVTIDGPGMAVVTISGNDSSRIFNISDNAATLQTVTIGGLSLVHGTGFGGAIRTTENLALHDVTITDSTGAVSAAGPLALTVTNATISNNPGGGISMGSVNATISHSTFSNNYNPGGGAISQSFGSLQIANTLITGNRATKGGGVNMHEGTTSIVDSIISGNTASVRGGGLYGSGTFYNSAGTLTVKSTTFSGNGVGRQYGSGGAVAVIHLASATFENVTMTGNTGAYFGASVMEAGAPVSINLSTISGNEYVLPDEPVHAGRQHHTHEFNRAVLADGGH